MAHVVFLRAANVGGKNVFRPAQLARDLAHLDVVNVGAAGTFVVRAEASATAVRREIAARLPFAAEMAVRPAREVAELVRSAPFRGAAFSKDVRGWVTVLVGKPKSRPVLSVLHPPARQRWSVRLDRVEGSYALGIWRRRPDVLAMPSSVIEDALGVRATTRWWETFERVAALALATGDAGRGSR